MSQNEKSDQERQLNRFDPIESLKPRDPFTQKVREILDREFPLIDIDFLQRDYSRIAAQLDSLTYLHFMRGIVERKVLGKSSPENRFFSIPEVTVGVTFLAGQEYKRGGREGFEQGSVYFRGDLTVQAGNETAVLYSHLSKWESLEVEFQMRNICGLIVGGIWGVSRLEETFKKYNANYFISKEVQTVTAKLIEDREQGGKIPQGGGRWWKEFEAFVVENSKSPLDNYLLLDKGISGDPYSSEASEKVFELLEKMKAAGRTDPTLERVADYLRELVHMGNLSERK